MKTLIAILSLWTLACLPIQALHYNSAFSMNTNSNENEEDDDEREIPLRGIIRGIKNITNTDRSLFVPATYAYLSGKIIIVDTSKLPDCFSVSITNSISGKEICM